MLFFIPLVTASDLVTSLPGITGPMPTMYSGYINASETKHIHYILVEAETDPDDKPLVIWFNGGPGCSSLDGFLYEHGPFRFKPYNGSAAPELVPFEYSWVKLANMLYIEQPVGVGFSYSTAADTTVDYTCTDDTAAADNLAAVQNFFVKYPQYLAKDLYITGESYAGIYVPTLAEAILQADDYKGAPLKGIAVGNGCSGDEIGICAFGSSTQGAYYTTKFLMSSGFVPETLKQSLQDTCDWDAWSQGGASGCDAQSAELDSLTRKLDTYCVYCDCGQQFSGGSKRAKSREQMRFKHMPAIVESALPATTACIDSDAASAYLNDPAVQEALHVTEANNLDWAVCNDAPGWSYSSTRPNLPRDTYPLLVSKIRTLIYNGDWDACVPYTDNEAWTKSMGYNTTQDWHAWFVETNGFQSVGGYATQYDVDGWFTFTTVRGGRHEVPETAPERAFQMMTTFLSGGDF